MRVRATGFCLLLTLAAAAAAGAQTVRVPANYPTIQSAINAVVGGAQPDGTVIEVQAGTYSEALLINATARSMTIRGISGPASTVVNAAGTGQTALRILNASGLLRIEGLTFT